jgi:transposase-like protein
MHDFEIGSSHLRLVLGIRRLGNAGSKAWVARDLGLHLNVLKARLKQFDQDPDNLFPGKGKMGAEEAELFIRSPTASEPTEPG